MSKVLLTLTVLFEVFVAQQYDYEYFINGHGGKNIPTHSQAFIDAHNQLFLGQNDASQFRQGHFHRFQNQATQSPLQSTTTQDPRTLGCGTPPANCPKARYRSLDGSCNNLRNPVWGTPQTPYNRLLPAKYGDGISSPTEAKSGRPLPLSRLVSLVFFPDVPIKDPKFTLAAMQYGQIITHDMSMIAGSTQSTPHQTRCCTAQGQILEGVIPEHCFAIILPKEDPISAKTNVRCMNFVRTITDRDRNCVGGSQPAEQLTAVNHFLDLSVVYGNTDQINQQLREFRGGRLLTARRNGQEWLPQNPNVTGTCPAVQTLSEPCYFAGDVRVNQNPQLTLIQIVLLREHNRLAKKLSQINPHWNDETIYQEARRINIAVHQHITYYEWLPIFIGVKNSLANKIVYETKDFVDDYNENVDPTIINEHSTAAFRFFHALIAGHLDLISEKREGFGNIRMSDWFNRPAVLEQGNNFDDLARGMATQPELKSNQFADSEITQFLFRAAGEMFGLDLKAFDVHRNRDHGLASYNDFRHYCGLPKAHTFEDFLDVISSENVQKLSTLYESPDDVDLTVGGTLEKLVPGTLSGPVFLCILTEQFYRSRVGDRFFYENGNKDNGFTMEQLNEIRKASISRLLCDNGKNIKSMQPNGFERISKRNAIVPCESLPALDLSYWQDLRGSSEEPQLKSHFDFRNPDFLFKKK